MELFFAYLFMYLAIGAFVGIGAFPDSRYKEAYDGVRLLVAFTWPVWMIALVVHETILFFSKEE